MQVAHPIIAPTIDNNGIYSIVIDNNRTRTGNIKNMVLVQKTMELIIIELELVTIEIMVLVKKSWQILTSF